MSNTTLTAIDGLLAGHATDDRNHTGCTAILCPQGFTPGIAVPGFAPGWRNEHIHQRSWWLSLCGHSPLFLADAYNA